MNFEDWYDEGDEWTQELSPREIARNAYEAAQPKWLDIETAPKDGQLLLLGWFNELGKWRSVNGQWFSKEQIADEWSLGEWDEENIDDLEGWYEVSIECHYEESCWKIKPTHWMPKPKPPEI